MRMSDEGHDTGIKGFAGSGSNAYRTLFLVIGAIAVVFAITAVYFMVTRYAQGWERPSNSAQVITILSVGFTVVGSLVGAYFGVKASSDASEAAVGDATRAWRANEAAARAVALSELNVTAAAVHRAEMAAHEAVQAAQRA